MREDKEKKVEKEQDDDEIMKFISRVNVDEDLEATELELDNRYQSGL